MEERRWSRCWCEGEGPGLGDGHGGRKEGGLGAVEARRGGGEGLVWCDGRGRGRRWGAGWVDKGLLGQEAGVRAAVTMVVEDRRRDRLGRRHQGRHPGRRKQAGGMGCGGG